MIDEKKLIEEIRDAINCDQYDGYKPATVLFEVWDMIKEQPKVGEWIPSDVGVPECDEDVEVTTKNGERQIGYYAGGCWCDSISGDYIQVIAWKEPSEPWEGEENEVYEYLDIRNPEKAVEIVEKWAAEHPAKTRQSEFLKMFPNAKLYDGEKLLAYYPCDMDVRRSFKDEKCAAFKGDCYMCRKEYWNEEMR